MNMQQNKTPDNQSAYMQKSCADKTHGIGAGDTQGVCADARETTSFCISADTSPCKRVTTIVSWVLVILWSGFIFFMSAHTGNDLNEGTGIVSTVFRMLHETQTALIGPDVDIVSSIGHFCEYVVFGALWASALHNHLSLRNAIVLAIVFSSIYGITDEFHQLFVPDRMCDPVDWAVDTVGATLGAVVTRAVLGRRNASCCR